VDLEAREKWFYQAFGMSPAMVRREPGAGSLYWLGTRDKNGNYLDGTKSYELVVPRPVPAGLFWSVTVYDADTRSQIETKQGRAALAVRAQGHPRKGSRAPPLRPARAPTKRRALDPDPPG